jgi:hypothetical protein
MWKRMIWNTAGHDNAGHDNEDSAALDPVASASLDRLFHAYREACPDPDAGANFMPQLWSKIEARENSSNLFGRMAKALVTAAVAASLILGVLLSTVAQSASNYNGTYYNGTYVEALMADHASGLEPLNLDRISELEQQ